MRRMPEALKYRCTRIEGSTPNVRTLNIDSSFGKIQPRIPTAYWKFLSRHA